MVKGMKPKKLNVYSDSQLIVGQVCGPFKVKEGKMAKYQKRIQEQLKQIKGEDIEVKVFRVPKEENHEVDLVANLAASRMVEMPKGVLVEMVEIPCIKKMLIFTIEKKEDWRTPIMKYLWDNTLLPNLEEA